jgi:hypothetical protein
MSGGHHKEPPDVGAPSWLQQSTTESRWSRNDPAIWNVVDDRERLFMPCGVAFVDTTTPWVEIDQIGTCPRSLGIVTVPLLPRASRAGFTLTLRSLSRLNMNACEAAATMLPADWSPPPVPSYQRYDDDDMSLARMFHNVWIARTQRDERIAANPATLESPLGRATFMDGFRYPPSRRDAPTFFARWNNRGAGVIEVCDAANATIDLGLYRMHERNLDGKRHTNALRRGRQASDSEGTALYHYETFNKLRPSLVKRLYELAATKYWLMLAVRSTFIMLHHFRGTKREELWRVRHDRACRQLVRFVDALRSRTHLGGRFADGPRARSLIADRKRTSEVYWVPCMLPPDWAHKTPDWQIHALDQIAGVIMRDRFLRAFLERSVDRSVVVRPRERRAIRRYVEQLPEASRRGREESLIRFLQSEYAIDVVERVYIVGALTEKAIRAAAETVKTRWQRARGTKDDGRRVEGLLAGWAANVTLNMPDADPHGPSMGRKKTHGTTKQTFFGRRHE